MYYHWLSGVYLSDLMLISATPSEIKAQLGSVMGLTSCLISLINETGLCYLEFKFNNTLPPVIFNLPTKKIQDDSNSYFGNPG